MATARVAGSGRYQVVLLPKEIRLKVDRVEIYRRGDEIILREKPRRMARVLDILAELPDDVLDGISDDGPPQKRKGLSRFPILR